MTAHGVESARELDSAVRIVNPSGGGQFVLVCEHASNFIPGEFDNLGLADDALQSHIAWDAGALAVAEGMSAKLDAPLIAPRVSRLVCDCNRPLEAQSSIVEESEIYEIPGNVGLSDAQRQARADRYYMSFHETLAACLDRRLEQGRETALVTVHSFTPVYHGVSRNTEIGVIHDVDRRFADALFDASDAVSDWMVRRNEPYGPDDGVTFTLATHAVSRRLPNVMLEIRSDLIATGSEQQRMAELLSGYVAKAMDTLLRRRENGGGRDDR